MLIRRVEVLQKEVFRLEADALKLCSIINKQDVRVKKLTSDLQELLNKANTFESFDISDKDYCMPFRLVCADLKGILERALR